MPRFHVDNRIAGSQQALAAAFKTGVALYNTSGGTASFGRLSAITCGLDGSPNSSTDTQIIFDVQRLTASGVGTTVTPNALRNPAGLAAAPRNTCQVNFTTEPTYAAAGTLWIRVANQRGAWQWNAYDMDSYPEWTGIASSAGAVPSGVGVRGSGGAAPVTANFMTAVDHDE